MSMTLRSCLACGLGAASMGLSFLAGLVGLVFIIATASLKAFVVVLSTRFEGYVLVARGAHLAIG